MATKETTQRRPQRKTTRSGNPSSAAYKMPQRRKKRAPAADVVYTQPAPFNRDRFILMLLTVVAVVLALLFGMAIFFKVEVDNILVSGTHKYTAYDIVKASGIKDGEALLTLRKPEISGRIIEALPYVEKVRPRIKLPDTVIIEIEEADVVYSVEATDGSWWLIRADGRVVDKTNPADASRTTTVKGLRIADPVIGKQAVAEEPVPEETEEGAEQVTEQITVLGSEKLETLISILGFMEGNGIIGDATSVNVENPNNLELQYGTRYRVVLGDRLNLDHKIKSMKAAMDQMKDYSSGVLDVSFTVKETEVIFTPES